jgi:hypothetical protein
MRETFTKTLLYLVARGKFNGKIQSNNYRKYMDPVDIQPACQTQGF